MPRDRLFRADYALDAKGRRVLFGLSADETLEFERVDSSPPFRGRLVWPDLDGKIPRSPLEARWLELWNKHVSARDRPAGGVVRWN